jgi:hypothetical protein
MTLKWRKTDNGHVADPVSTAWVRDIVYEIYPENGRVHGRYAWSVLKQVGGGERHALCPIQRTLAAAKEHAEFDLAGERDWHRQASQIRHYLHKRTRREWSTRRGRGTSAHNIYVSSPADRKVDRYGNLMVFADRIALADAFELPLESVGPDMVMIHPERYAEYLKKLQRE